MNNTNYKIDIIKEIEKYNNNNSTIIMLIDKKTGRREEYRGYNISLSKKTHKGIAEMYHSNLCKILKDKDFERFDFNLKGKGKIQVIDRKLIEKISKIDDELKKEIEYSNTISKDTIIDNINCVAVRYYYEDEKGNHKLTIYARYRQLNKKFKKSFKLTFEGKKMIELEEQIVYFDGEIEMFEFDNKCYVVNEAILYSIFDFDLNIKQIIKNRKKDIIEDNFIDKPEKFIDICESDKGYSKRLCNVLISYDKNYMKSNKNNLKEYLKEFKINLKLNDNNQLIIENKNDANNIIKILSRIFVYDGLSREKMEVKGVEKIIGR